MSPVLPPDLTIVLLGNAGVGKSASGNTILGRTTAFESKLDFKPVTTEISEQTGNVLGKRISVVDTPGILGSKEEIMMYCKNKFSKPKLSKPKLSKPKLSKPKLSIPKLSKPKLSKPKLSKPKLSIPKLSKPKLSKPKLSKPKFLDKDPRKTSEKAPVADLSSRRCLFLVVIRVGLFTEEDQKAVTAAVEVLNDLEVMKKSFLLFTGGDELQGSRLEEFIFEHLLNQFAGYHLFNNKKDDKEQVRELLLKSGHLPTQDQPDPPDNGGHHRYINTIFKISAGAVMGATRVAVVTIGAEALPAIGAVLESIQDLTKLIKNIRAIVKGVAIVLEGFANMIDGITTRGEANEALRKLREIVELMNSW